jgi:pimeloyl-ACP methyl ester carboxylesterase
LISKHFKYRLGSPPLFSDAELQSLSMPVLYLAGEEDALLNTPKTAARLQQLVSNITLKVIPGKGHALTNTASQVLPCLQLAYV